MIQNNLKDVRVISWEETKGNKFIHFPNSLMVTESGWLREQILGARNSKIPLSLRERVLVRYDSTYVKAFFDRAKRDLPDSYTHTPTQSSFGDAMDAVLSLWLEFETTCTSSRDWTKYKQFSERLSHALPELKRAIELTIQNDPQLKAQVALMRKVGKL